MPQYKPLPSFERDQTITAPRLRSIGYIPATVYGKGVTPLALQIKAHEFEIDYYHGHRFFELQGLSQSYKAEAKQVQIQSGKQTILHVEFHVAQPATAKPAKAATLPAAEAKVEEPVTV